MRQFTISESLLLAPLAALAVTHYLIRVAPTGLSSRPAAGAGRATASNTDTHTTAITMPHGTNPYTGSHAVGQGTEELLPQLLRQVKDQACWQALCFDQICHCDRLADTTTAAANHSRVSATVRAKQWAGLTTLRATMLLAQIVTFPMWLLLSAIAPGLVHRTLTESFYQLQQQYAGLPAPPLQEMEHAATAAATTTTAGPRRTILKPRCAQTTAKPAAASAAAVVGSPLTSQQIMERVKACDEARAAHELMQSLPIHVFAAAVILNLWMLFLLL